MEWEEFKRVTRHIEPEFFESANPREVFDQYAEYDEQNELSVSLKSFNKLAKEQSLFKSVTLSAFMSRKSGRGFVGSIDDLRVEWARGLEAHIINLLKASEAYKPEMQILIFKLGKLVKGFEPKIKEKLWMNYILLEAEVSRLFLEKVLVPELIARELLVFGE